MGILFNQLNVGLFNLINYFAGRNVFLDKIGIVLAKYSPIIFVLFLLYLWFGKKENKNIGLFSGYSAVLGLLLNFSITLFYFHPRPFMDHIGTLLIDHSAETSFPSDHTTFMLSVAFMLLYFKKTRKVGILLAVFGFIGGLARVFCGVHYPFDIFGSIFVAMFSSYMIFLSLGRLQKFNDLIINLYSKVLKYGK